MKYSLILCLLGVKAIKMGDDVVVDNSGDSTATPGENVTVATPAVDNGNAATALTAAAELSVPGTPGVPATPGTPPVS
jgi:hypothetical protein